MGVEVESRRVLNTDRVVETVFTKQPMQMCREGFDIENIRVSWRQGHTVEIVIAGNKVAGEQGEGFGSRECIVEITKCTLFAIERIRDNIPKREVTEFTAAI